MSSDDDEDDTFFQNTHLPVALLQQCKQLARRLAYLAYDASSIPTTKQREVSAMLGILRISVGIKKEEENDDFHEMYQLLEFLDRQCATLCRKYNVLIINGTALAYTIQESKSLRHHT